MLKRKKKFTFLKNKMKHQAVSAGFWWKLKVNIFSALPQCMPWAMLIMAILLFSCSRQEMLSTPIRFVWVAPGWKWRKFNFLTCRRKKKIMQCYIEVASWARIKTVSFKKSWYSCNYSDVWPLCTLKLWMGLYAS